MLIWSKSGIQPIHVYKLCIKCTSNKVFMEKKIRDACQELPGLFFLYRNVFGMYYT